MSPSQPPSNLNQMLPSPGMMPSPATNLNQVMPSPASNMNQVMHSPASNVNQIMQSPSSNVNQIIHSPASNVNQIMSSPASNVNQIMPSPASNINQVMPSPASNVSQVMPSPGTAFNQMMSPASNYSGIQNSLMSPGLNQMVASPSSNISHVLGSPASTLNQVVPPSTSTVNPSSNMNPPTNLNQMVPSPMSQIVQSPMSGHCHGQIMSPNHMMIQSHINHVLQNPNVMPNSVMQNSNAVVQNTNGMILNSNTNMVQNSNRMHNLGGIMMNSNLLNGIMQPQNCPPIMENNARLLQHQDNHNNCYDRPNCFMSHGNWDNNQNKTCRNNNQLQQTHNMCHSRNSNVDYSNQCKPSGQINNSYVNMPHCNSHSYQMCNQTNFIVNGCQQMKPINNYECSNGYPHIQNRVYGCVPNMNEPLPSPAMGTPAPNEIINQPSQQAQMTRPCTHYGQDCYRNIFNDQQCENGNESHKSCGCHYTTNKYPQSKCSHQCSKNEIQCRDVSQSQVSPDLSKNPNQNQSTTITTLQPVTMRQDTYQRTLEYVQNCQSWVNTTDMVSSTTNPLGKCTDTSTSNMIINDMTSSLSSLLEENRYLQMIQ